MTKPVQFVVTDYLQRLETWAMVGSRVGLDIEAIKQMATGYAAAVLVPVCGKAAQRIGTTGFEPDGFMLKSGSFRFAALAQLQRAVVMAWIPAQHAGSIEVVLSCGNSTVAGMAAPGTLFRLELPLEVAPGSEESFEVALSATFQPAALPEGGPDTRHLGCLIQSIEFS